MTTFYKFVATVAIAGVSLGALVGEAAAKRRYYLDGVCAVTQISYERKTVTMKNGWQVDICFKITSYPECPWGPLERIGPFREQVPVSECNEHGAS